MALLQSGVDIAVIALWLGHESIETTNKYLHADLSIKEKALAKVQPPGSKFRRFRADDTLLAFLATLRLCQQQGTPNPRPASSGRSTQDSSTVNIVLPMLCVT
jgi:hypothetical protein